MMERTPDLDTFIQQISWKMDARLHDLSTNEELIFQLNSNGQSQFSHKGICSEPPK